MIVDEEILRENSISERRYILTIVRDKIAALNDSDEDSWFDPDDEGYESCRNDVLAIVDVLLGELA